MFRIPKQQVESPAFGVFARVVAKRELIYIPLQVLFGGKVVDADDTSFEERPEALDGVGIYIAANILTRAMINVVVLE